MITHKEFRINWLGKKRDYDGVYGEQCVDLVRLYYKEVYGLELGSFSGSALQGWLTGSPFNNKGKKINNTPTFIPKVGDIAFFDKTLSNVYGHVAIVSEGSTMKVLNVLEQNAGMGKGKGEGSDSIRLHGYNYITPKFLGVYRLNK